jgi:hypothetical protein
MRISGDDDENTGRPQTNCISALAPAADIEPLAIDQQTTTVGDVAVRAGEKVSGLTCHWVSGLT